MELYGKKYTRRDLEGFTGDLRQIADVRLATLDDGMERGTRIAQVRTGSGFDFTVLLDRGMDIGTATYNGIPLAWQSGTGAANPNRAENTGLGWLRTFHGGLLALCGLSQVGPGGVVPVNGEELGQHGRIGTVPAYDIGIERVWDGDDWKIRLRGSVDETVLFGYRLHLERTMEFTVGQPSVTLHDSVTNRGGQAAPLMILYHCNLGWPIVSPDSEVISPTGKLKPRDAAAAPGSEIWNQMQEPTPTYAEQVFYHEVPSTEKQVSASIVNRVLGLGVEISFNPDTLPNLTQWKQMGYADYVMGIEPGNCFPEGRIEARNTGNLRMLPPGATDHFTVGFRVLTKV